MAIRFLPKLMQHLRYYSIHGEHPNARISVDYPLGHNTSKVLLGGLEDPNTKRILFDARQAMLFVELDEIPEDVQSKIKLPFDQFYLEFTEPIRIGESQPGYEDFMRGLFISADGAEISNTRDGEPITLSLAHVTVFLTSYGEEQFIDRSWKIHIPTGSAFVSIRASLSPPDPSEVPSSQKDRDGYFQAGIPFDKSLKIGDSRYIGWWERITIEYTTFISWVLVYMMAKGIHITEQQISKKERKRFERHKHPIKPWHIITVEPRITTAMSGATGYGTKHSYRYDVMGHLRFGKHRVKTKDGWGYVRHIEWIAPHQRGLQHSKYIPALRQYKPGKAIHPIFKEYMESK
jgi:hypothetical protein